MKNILIPPFFVALSLILIILFYIVLPEYNYIPFPLNLSGILVAFFGFVIMGKARDLFKKHKTTLKIEQSSSLITEGIFSKTRNPMYLGMFLLILGISFCFRNIFSLLTAFCFLVLIHFMFVLKEEKMMFKTFGDEFSSYKQNVRRWF